MKRFFICLFICMVLFAGCNSDNPDETEENDTKIEYPEVSSNQILYTNNKNGYSGDVVIYKYNTTDYTINAENTGYVSKIGETSKRKSTNKTRTLKSKELDYLIGDYNSVTDFQRRQWDSIAKIPNNAARGLYRSGTSPNPNTPKDKFYIYKNIYDDENNVTGSKRVALNVSASDSENSIILMKEGSHCNVYYTDNLNSSYANEKKFFNSLKASQKDLNYKNLFTIVQETFDNIYSLETKYLGSNVYSVDSDSKYANTSSKVNLIIMDINEDAKEDTSSGLTLGFYAPGDLIKSNIPGASGSGNEAQILYLDSQALLINYKILMSTIVHEFNHLLNDINKVVTSEGKNSGMETWYTEMLSMLAEDMFADVLGLKFSSTPKTRLADFPDSYYLGFTTWLYGDEVYSSYANAFAYGSYLVRNYGGVDFVKELACNIYTDKTSINEALKNMNYKIKFEDTIKDYYIATYNENSSGYTFNREISNNKDGLGFKALNMSALAQYKDGSYLDARPNIVDATNESMYDLLPTGCTIHYVGTNLDYFVFEKPNSSTLKYEIVEY